MKLSEQLNEFITLADAEFSTPLPTEKHNIQQLRERIARAEAYGITVANFQRNLAQLVDTARAKNLNEAKNDDEFLMMKVAEKKIVLDSMMSREASYADYLDSVQDIIKRRCSVGQSILKSLEAEERTKIGVNL